MKIPDLQLGDIALITLRRQPTLSFHARIEGLPDPKSKVRMVMIRKQMNGVTGRLAGSTKFVWTDEVVRVVARNGIPVVQPLGRRRT